MYAKSRMFFDFAHLLLRDVYFELNPFRISFNTFIVRIGSKVLGIRSCLKNADFLSFRQLGTPTVSTFVGRT